METPFSRYTREEQQKLENIRYSISLGHDPIVLAIPGDTLVGVTTIPFAIFLWKGYSWSKYALVVWNVLGIADLVMAVSLGFITSSISAYLQ